LDQQNSEQESVPPSVEVGQLRRFNELLLRFLPIGVVIIDRGYRILTANGVARRLLGLHDVGIDQDFLHAIRGIPYHETRTAIDAVFRERSFITLPEVELEMNSGGSGRFVSLSIALMQVEPGLPDLAVISVSDVDEQVQIRRQLEHVQVEQTQLMQELGSANKRLSDMNKELMDANEELQVSNEELMLTHEELQASIEEFETTNEELQATNEELETNNEEMQATNEELETTNEELRARTGELQELATVLETERLRLSEIVEIAPFYILVLRGPNLIVDAYNLRSPHFQEGREIQGRPLEEVSDLFWEPRSGFMLLRLAREVYIQETPRTIPRVRTVIPGTQQETDKELQEWYFAYKIVPIHNASGRVDGVIIYASDETEQQAREVQEEFTQLKAIFDNTTRMAVLALFDAQTQALLMCSPRYLELVAQQQNRNADDITGRSWQEATLLTSEEDALECWKNVVESRTPFRIPELVVSSASGRPETIWDYDLTPISTAEDAEKVNYVFVFAVEITQQVYARKNLERLEKR
jgi:hypothetical protein